MELQTYQLILLGTLAMALSTLLALLDARPIIYVAVMVLGGVINVYALRHAPPTETPTQPPISQHSYND